MSLFFCFNDPATTEIYTYCHTLALHDALPILRPQLGFDLRGDDKPLCVTKSSCAGSGLTLGPAPIRSLSLLSGPRPASPIAWRNMRACLRSEEHTSELQSLMRNSYAVFGLKKKKTSTRAIGTTNITITKQNN